MKILSIELWRIFIARVILHQSFDIFQILKDVSVLEKVDFRPWDFLQEEWRILGVFWSSCSTIVKSSSSGFVWVWLFERWYFVSRSIVFRILENVTFDGLHYCSPPFTFAFHRDSYHVWKYLHFLVRIVSQYDKLFSICLVLIILVISLFYPISTLYSYFKVVKLWRKSL